MKTTKDIALAYFNSWQEPADYEAFRRELAEDVVFDGGAMRIEGAEALTAMVRETELPWNDIVLLASLFTADAAVLFYDGTEKRTGARTRVGEHLTIEGGKITRIVASIAPLPDA